MTLKFIIIIIIIIIIILGRNLHINLYLLFLQTIIFWLYLLILLNLLLWCLFL